MRFQLTMDLSPLQFSSFTDPFGLWIDWGESQNSDLNTFTLSEISGILPLGQPEPFGQQSGNLTDGVTVNGGGIFWQGFHPTSDPLRMVVSLTSHCNLQNSFVCDDGSIEVGIVPLTLIGGSEDFMNIKVDRPIIPGVFPQAVLGDTSQTTHYLTPHVTPFAPTPEPSVFSLLVLGLIALVLWQRWAKR